MKKGSSRTVWRSRTYARGLCILAYIALCTLGFLLNQPLLVVVVSILSITVFLPVRKLGFICRMFVVISAYMGANTLIAFLPWVFKINISAWLFSGFIFIVGLCFVIFCRFARPDRWFSIGETVSFIVAVTVFMLLSIQSFATFRSPDLLKVVNGSGVDNVAHFAFTEAVSDQGGYLYGARGSHLPINSMLGAGANNYPQGYHINAWFFNDITQPFMGELTDINRKMVGFLLGSIINYSLLVFAFVFFAIQMINLGGNKRDYLRLIVVVACAIYVLLNLIFSIYTDGFIPQVMSLHLMITTILLLTMYCKETEVWQKCTYGVLALLCVVGVGLSYFFLLPVVLGTFIITVICDYFYSTSRAGLSIYWLITLLAGGMLSIAHGVVYVVLQNVTADKINDKGGVLMLDVFYAFSLAIFALAYLWHICKKGVTSPITISLLLSFGFSLALLVFQKITTGSTSYYYYKSTLSLLLLTSLVGTLLMVFIYDKVSSYGVRTLLLVSAILFSLSNGVGVFGTYFSGGVKSAFSAPYLFDYVVAIVENPTCRDRSTAILSIRSDQKTDGDIFFNRSLMALSRGATSTQEIIARWSMSNADISMTRSTITKAIAESENIQPNSRLLVLTKSDQIKESLLGVLGPDRIMFIDPENTTKDDLQQVCSSLNGSF